MKIQVIQYEESGIPQEPFITSSKELAADDFISKVISQGFRSPYPNESITAFLEAYQNLLINFDDLPDETIDPQTTRSFDRDDCVRWWELDLEAPNVFILYGQQAASSYADASFTENDSISDDSLKEFLDFDFQIEKHNAFDFQQILSTFSGWMEVTVISEQHFNQLNNVQTLKSEAR